MAAAESFLAFNAGAAAAASRRRSRGPRNRKKGWKRWSGPEARLGREIGDFLEDVGLQERAAGGLISDQPNEGLFFLDTGSTAKSRAQKKKKPLKKPLHVDLVLQPLSKVPPPKNITSHQTPNGRKERRRREFWEKKAKIGIFPRGERRLRARLARGGAGDPRGGSGDPQGGAGDPQTPPQKPPELGRSDPQRDFYDIWGEHNPLDAPLAGQDPWYLQQTKRMRVQRPPRLQAKPSPLPPVEVIGQGGSYNPPFQDHQDLLLRALEVETRRRREEEKVERRLKVTEEPPSQEALLREQLQGLLEEEEEEDEEVQQQEEEDQSPARKREQPGRKTEKQRRKEKEQREKAGARARARLALQRQQGLFQLRSLRRALLLRELQLRLRARLRQRRRRLRETAPRRLGRLRYEELDPEVQLSEELPESLRSLRPEGNVLRDRFKSLQRRNMIEPRLRAKFKRRYRVKYVEKRSFRAVTL